MHFLRTVFWIVVAVALVLFAAGNWTTVTIALSTTLRMDIKLPVLVIGAFLIGLLPTLIAHNLARWRLMRRIATLERAGAGPFDDGVAERPAEIGRGGPRLATPPGAVPTAVPPGVA